MTTPQDELKKAIATHPMSEQWMHWKTINTAPDHGKEILVGFKGQFRWVSYVAPAHGNNTGQHQPFARPTHWTPIIPPQDTERRG